ncbi:MAG TPA: sodium:proton antiporter [Gammaproteobacteria bacterium]|nr:sodium:proton antiporter [Gammaproteobacteria bacterium]
MHSHLTLVLASIAALGMLAQWLAWRVRLPAIVLLTVFGLIAGPASGWLRPSADLGAMLEPLIKLGVAAILFEGGLSLQFHELRQAAVGVRRLVSIGVVIALALGGAAAHYIGGLSWPVAWVFGAIIVVTGPTVIVPMLRQARLNRRPASYLKWEGIINDPIGALLAVLIFEYFSHAQGDIFHELLGRVGAGLLAAAALGIGGGLLLGNAFRRGYVPEYLKGPVSLAAAVGVYVLANLVLDESGLLAATILGIVLGNMRLPSIGEIKRFKEYVAIVLVSAVFLLLTADLDPHTLLTLDWRSVALLGAILFVVRPATIFLSTIGAGMTLGERTLLGWIAPRGIVAAAVAGVFGPQLAAKGYAGAELLLPLVFALILTTVVLHGFSIGWLARRLKLSAQSRNGVLIVGASPWTTALAETLKGLEVPVLMVDGSWHRLRAARLAGTPVYYGDVLAEAAEYRLEFNELGYVLAATDNDAYNTLVCSLYANEVGRHRVFQLPQFAADENGAKRHTRTTRGLVAPSRDAQYETLIERWYRGWTFQKTHLTEEFGFDDCMAACPEGAIAVALVRGNEEVLFLSPDYSAKPRPGDVVVWFGTKQDKPRTDADAEPAQTEHRPRSGGGDRKS